MKYPKQAFDAHGGRVAEYMIVVDATIVRLCHHPRLLHAACESRDWEGLVQLARSELVATRGLVDLARRYRAPSDVVSTLCETAGLPALSARPPFVAQRFPGRLQKPAETDGRGPSAPDEADSNTYFAAVAPAEILAERTFDIRVRAFTASQLQEVCIDI